MKIEKVLMSSANST